MGKLDIISSRILSGASLERQLLLWRFHSNRIAFTNGCFDILHRGHIDYLARAADLANMLVVGVNSDASVKRLGKGSSRPLLDERSRALIIASLQFVSAVVIFDEDTPLELIRLVKPDVLVKGADYDANETNPANPQYIVGSDLVRAGGGKVQTIPFLEGYSTTAIEKKIKG